MATVTIADCEESGCHVAIEATSEGTANTPGLLHLVTTFTSGDGSSVCIRTEDVLDETLPCERLCDRLGVGMVVACQGTSTGFVAAPRGGDSVSLWVSFGYTWNEVGALAHTFAVFRIQQQADGSATVFAYPT